MYVLEAAVQRISCSSRLFVGARLFHGVPRYIDTSHGAHANPQLVIRGHLQFPVVVLAGMPTGARAPPSRWYPSCHRVKVRGRVNELHTKLIMWDQCCLTWSVLRILLRTPKTQRLLRLRSSDLRRPRRLAGASRWDIVRETPRRKHTQDTKGDSDRRAAGVSGLPRYPPRALTSYNVN